MADQKNKRFSQKAARITRICLRLLIQLIFFIFFPSAFSSAFAGIKYIFIRLGIKEPLAFTGFIQVLLVLCLFTIVFGRFFCGFACAFGSLGDWLHSLYLLVCKKCRKEPLHLPSLPVRILNLCKYAVLLAIVIMCFLNVYNKTDAWNPWTAFSLLRAGNLRLSAVLPGFILFFLLLIGMTIFERFFCRFFCPMGAVFSLLPVIPLFAVRRRTYSCARTCGKCLRSCPAELAIPAEHNTNVPGDCFQCQKCLDACPAKNNISSTCLPLKGNEIWLMLLKAAALIVIFILLGL